MPEENITISPQPTAHSHNSWPKISIIVPVYNTEKYLAKCLDSLINQEIPERNYEIIITDDGSTDRSGEICDIYAEKYPFIHVTHTENRGPGHARNIALAQCRGKYITFCDSDDYASPCLISVLSNAMEVLGQPDVIVFRHYTSINIPAKGFPVYNAQDMKKDDAEISDGEELCVRILESNKVGGFIWNKLIRAELAKSLVFDENLKVAMDHEWLLRLFASRKNAKVSYINYFLYCYVQILDFGQTRDVKRVYGHDGMQNIILTFEKELADENHSQKVRRMIEGAIYWSAVTSQYCNEVSFSDEVKRKLKSYTKNYAFTFYFRTSISFTFKAKAFIKHILIFFHIHKPRKK